MYRIDQDIKNGTYARAYLLYGEERYLLVQYKDKLLKALGGTKENMNFIRYEGKDVSIEKVIDFAETMPFFADYRVILVMDSGLFKSNSKETENFAKYVANIPESAVIVFCEEEVDKRYPLFKAVNKLDRAIDFVLPKEEILDRWLTGRIRKEGGDKNITREAMTLFKDYVGMDMGSLDREMDKLLCYCADKQIIEADDVRAVCTQQLSNRVFEMISALIVKDKKKALAIYYDLLGLKEPAAKTYSLIVRQYNQLLKIKELQALGYRADDMAAIVSLPSYVVSKLLRQAQGLTTEVIRDTLEYAVDLDTRVKTGKMTDTIAIELIINRCCG